MNDEELREKPQPISLDELNLEDDSLSIDPEADAFARPAPPPDGQYIAKISLFKGGKTTTGFEVGKDKNGRAYVMASLQLEIAEEGDYKGMKLYDRASTVVMQSTGTCRIAGILQALGVKVPQHTGQKELAKLLELQLEGSPLVGIETRWEASSLQEDGKYKTIARGMRKFPPRINPETNEIIPGVYVPRIEDPKTGEVVEAQAAITKYMPIGEVRK